MNMGCTSTKLTISSLRFEREISPGDDIADLLIEALTHSRYHLRPWDVVVVTSKALSKATGRHIDLAVIDASQRAREVAELTGKDHRLVELILREATEIVRQAPGVLFVRHKLGFVLANAGIDFSNVKPPPGVAGKGPWVLLLPRDPDEDASRIQKRLEELVAGPIGVLITDSWGRPFRLGTVGFAIGVAGMPPIWDQRGRVDRDGRTLQQTRTASADQLAAACDLVAGQADESRPFLLVRGLQFAPSEKGAASLNRPMEQSIF